MNHKTLVSIYRFSNNSSTNILYYRFRVSPVVKVTEISFLVWFLKFSFDVLFFFSLHHMLPSILNNSFSMFLQVGGIHLNKWKLDRKLGIYVLTLYAIFLCFSVLIEFNVFTFVNFPMCREDDWEVKPRGVIWVYFAISVRRHFYTSTPKLNVSPASST